MQQYLYAIKRNKEFLPKPRGQRGGSWVEPVSARLYYPRVFSELRHAKIYLSIWLKGQIPAETDWDDEGYWKWPGVPVPVPTRQRDDMDIVMLRIHPYTGGDTDFKVMYLPEYNGKFLAHPSISDLLMGREAREFDQESVYKAQYFKSHLAAHRYIIKWRRGPYESAPWMYFHAEPSRKLREEYEQQLADRKLMNITIKPYVYKEIK